MSSAGSLFVEILPSIKGINEAIRAEIVAPAKAAGANAGASIGEGISKGATEGVDKAATTIRERIVTAAKSAATSANAAMAGIGRGAASSITAEMKAAENAVVSAARNMAAARNTEADAAGKVRLAEERLSAAREKYAAGSSQVIAAEERLAKAERDQALAADAQSTATKKLRDAQAELAAVSSKVEKDQAAQKATALTNAFGSQGRAVTGLVEQYGKLGAVVGAAVVIGIGVKSVQAAMQFQQSQERLVTTAGELQSNLKTVSNGILSMAGQVGYSAQELSTGMYTVESAGYHGADGLKVMKAAAQGAKEENASLTTVTDAVTSAMRDYHLPAQQAALVTSKMVTAVGDGKTNFEQFTGAMSAVLPIASATHVGMSEVLGDLSSMTLHGMSAEQASQNLAMAIRSLANPTLAMTKEMSALGLNSADLSRNLGKKGVQGTMEQVSEVILHKMGPAGTTLLKSFNQSKQAAQDANTMFASLPPAAQKVAKAYQDGTLSYKSFRKEAGGLSADQANLLKQWANVQNQSKGFSDSLKTGGNAAQTYTQALAKATGNSTSMNVALMLTGENAAKTRQNIADVSKATTEAGNNTKGWADIQKTLAQKLSEVKAGIGAIGIKIGTALLPALTAMVGGFQSAVGWISQNRKWLGLLLAVIAGMLAPMVAVKTAMLAWSAATKIVAAAQWLLNAAMDANPIMLIVSLIAGLVVGLVYAYTHFKTFRDIVNSVGTFLKNVFVGALHGVEVAAKAVGAAAVWLWLNAIQPAFDGIAKVASWLWNTILKPVFNFIGEAAKILARIFLVVFIGPVVLLFQKVLAPVIHWIYNSVIKPVFDLIGKICDWIYRNVIKPMVDQIKLSIEVCGAIFQWLYDKVIHPVFNFIGVIFHWLYDNVIKPVIDDIKLGIHQWADVFQWIYDHVIKPVGGFIGDVMHGIGSAFSSAVKAIKGVWGTIEDIVKKPIKWVIQYVYDDGIVPVWNALSGVFDKSWAIKPLNVSSWAGGGILPGYAPGIDSIPAMLSPGESVLTPEATQFLGAQNILALNAMSGRPGGNATNGMPVHASGGWLGGIGHWISSAASSVWDGLKSAGDWVAKGIGAVTGNVGSLFGGIMGKVGQIPGQDNLVGQAMAKLPGSVLHMVIKKIKDWLGMNSGSGAGVAGVIPVGQHKKLIDQALAADGIPQSQWGKWEIGMNTLIGRESSWNPGIVNTWDSNAAAGHPSGGLTQTIWPTFEANRNPNLPNNMFDPVANIAASIRYILADYGDIGNVQQANANLPPKGYSGGGIVPGGPTTTTNNHHGANVNINLHGGGGSSHETAAELERRLTFAMR